MIGFKTEEAGKINLPQEYLQRIVDSIVLAVPETECIYLFGSYARGEEHEDSDVDLYVVTNKSANRKIDYEAMADAGVALLWMKKSKDILCLSKDEFTRRSKRKTGLERIVSSEGVEIYG